MRLSKKEQAKLATILSHTGAKLYWLIGDDILMIPNLDGNITRFCLADGKAKSEMTIGRYHQAYAQPCTTLNAIHSFLDISTDTAMYYKDIAMITGFSLSKVRRDCKKLQKEGKIYIIYPNREFSKEAHIIALK